MAQGLIGLAGLLGMAWLLSEDRRSIPWRLVAGCLIAQMALAALLLRVPPVRTVFLALDRVVDGLAAATRAGTVFVFGYLGGGPAPFPVSDPANGFVLAFQAMPLVLVISALSALLYHWRLLPVVVRLVSRVLERSFGLGGAVGICVAAMPFLGMIESPLLIRPYVARLSRGEMFVTMTGGLATIAGTVMVLYATFLRDVIPDSLGHLLTAAVISVPAAVMVARMVVPDETRTEGGLAAAGYSGSMDAVVRGTLDGVTLLIGILAVLLVLVALVNLANGVLAVLPPVAGAALTLQRMLGWLLAPVAWLMGVPWREVATVGGLLGTKIVLNELLAFLSLSHLPAGALSERSRLIATYALCGFANLGSLGILIAGLTAMAPERRGDVVALGPRALAAGALASCFTGWVVGIMV
jgi:concentrative nucleoside transporter, CNT family